MSQQPIFVVPKEGLIVRNPDGNFHPIPADGTWVNPTPYWVGQIRDGAVTEDTTKKRPPPRGKPDAAKPAVRTTPVRKAAE